MGQHAIVAGQGDDLPTNELLLAALCRLACAPGQPQSTGNMLLLAAASPKLQVV